MAKANNTMYAVYLENCQCYHFLNSFLLYQPRSEKTVRKRNNLKSRDQLETGIPKGSLSDIVVFLHLPKNRMVYK